MVVTMGAAMVATVAGTEGATVRQPKISNHRPLHLPNHDLFAHFTLQTLGFGCFGSYAGAAHLVGFLDLIMYCVA